METDFMPIDYDYFDYNGRNYLKIYGRNEEGKRICLIDSFEPYLWAVLKEGISIKKISKLVEKIKKIELDSKGRHTKVEKVEIKDMNFLGKKVKALKIFATNYKDLHEIANLLDYPEVNKRRGYDIGIVTNYIINKKLNPLQKYKISGEILTDLEIGGIQNILDVDFVLKLVSHKEIIQLKKSRNSDEFPKTLNSKGLNVLAYDLETDSLKPENGEILMISLVGKNFKKVITWKKSKTNKKYVEFVKDEIELIERFKEHLKEQTPDVLVGYNSDYFDLMFLKERAKKLKIKLNIGVDSSEASVSRGVAVIGRISGIVHVDLLRFIRTTYSQYMQSETLSLNEVSKEFLGDTKKDFKIKHSSEIEKEGWNDYYEYNLHDSVLTYQLFEKFWPDMLEFSRIIKEPLFEISRNGLSKQIESYILHNLEKYNEIPEKRPGKNESLSRREKGSVEGAFVFEPKPGLYEDLAMFDFTSMHTSIIISHNISKATLCEKEKNCYKSPEINIEGKNKTFYFKKESGFFPLLLKDIFDKRKQYKDEYKKNPNVITKARSNAFKLLSASAHGYIGFFGARYYSWEASSSILAFVRKYNKEIIKKIEEAGHEVIYGDTDSVAFTKNKKSKKEIKNLLNNLNNDLPGVMHLELENFFKRGLWVTTRSGETGAKKKYALIDDKGILKIRGFETVRRDWCGLARKTQDKIIRLILKDGNEKKALEYVKKIVKNLKERKISKEELFVKSQLKKPISEYKSISPHVVAAMKMKEREMPIDVGTFIEYYIGESNSKKKLVREGVCLSDEDVKYDIDYYLDKQILPSVENIFHVFNIEIVDIIKGNKQDKLGKWF
ncbi:MAG: DNA-directed DNA polymerase [Nanoarchaeota archaeon]|nr:DNA-directed DNA polymerase [Nanoarchaeota archaeon]